MKILFNCLTMEKGGAERVIALLANEFSKENDVSIISLMRSEDAYGLEPKVKRLRVDGSSHKTDNKFRKITRKLSVVRLSRMRKMIISEGPDIIISFLPEPSLKLMLLSKFSKKIRDIPKIISIRNDPKKEFSKPMVKRIMKKLYKDADGMVYQTEDAKNYFGGIIKTKHQEIIQNPIDPDMLIKPKKDGQRKNIIISVGRLEEQKNHEMLIRAFADTLKEKEHDYSLKICGEGSLRNYLQKLINELGLADRIVLVGQVDNIQKELNEAKIFVLSSRYEGMPNALIEAMAMRLPCISTDCPCGGPRSLIENGKNGILVENENKKVLSEAMLDLMGDRNKREIISRNAVLIRKKNNVGKIAGEWMCLMKDVIGSKK